jgi:hypothetical protein
MGGPLYPTLICQHYVAIVNSEMEFSNEDFYFRPNRGAGAKKMQL